MTVYLDTHVLIWLAQGDVDKVSARASSVIDDNELLVSPAVILELELLHEMGRVRMPARALIAILESQVGLKVCNRHFDDVVTHAVGEKWTRDPFDRLIVANAKAAAAPLVTKDERIRKHYRQALW